MRLAALLAKVATGDPAALPAPTGAARWRRSAARARWASTRAIGSLVAGQAGRHRRRRPGRRRRAALLRSGFAPGPRGRPRARDRRLGRRRTRRRRPRAARRSTKRRSRRARTPGRSDCNDRTDARADRHRRPAANVDPAELAKFGALAHRWWDPGQRMFGPLHEINPLRLDWIERVAGGLAGKRVARRRLRRRHPVRSRWPRAARASPASTCRREGAGRGASCTSSNPASRVDYRLVAAEALAARDARRASTSSPAWRCSSTCPIPASIVAACAALAKPGRHRRVLDDQPQPEVVSVRGHRRRVRAADCCRAARTTTRSSCSRPSSRRIARRAGLDAARDDRHDLQPADEGVPPRAGHGGQLHGGLPPRCRCLTHAARRRAAGARARCRSTRSCSTSTARSPTRRRDLGARAESRARRPRPRAAAARARCARYASHGARGLLGAGMGVTPGARRVTRRCATRFSRTTTRRSASTRRCSPASTRCSTRIEARALRWGIVTNKATRFTLPLLDRAGLAPRAGAVVCGDTTPHPKPHPAPLLHAARALGVAPGALRLRRRRRARHRSRHAPPACATHRRALRLHRRRTTRPDAWPADGQSSTAAATLLDWLPARRRVDPPLPSHQPGTPRR